ncbi:protein kinase [Nocardia halotolerans]|uniref:non-specific serine/threonine protein kinase n=1 Tax=Nocardia halotolerans TaxID=1755878 RepID=A0ABV8VG26_9NOCA
MLEAGASFAGYQLEGVLGRGGMGTVYLARHPRLPRNVALKVLSREFTGDQELQSRFEREADVVAQLDHPGIVGVYDRGSDGGYLWIAMQFIRGTDAAAWDSRAHRPAETARLLGETASALDYANRHDVLHRDVKPGNILIADAEFGRQTRAVLTDFGIARVTTATTQLTATGTFTATLAYASPEQLSGAVVDHHSDQYSLACTLFAMYAGHAPFAATNPGQVVAGHLSQPVPRLTSVRPDLPPAIDGVIARAMAKRRDERFGSATEFTDTIRNVLEGRHVAAPTVHQPWVDPSARGHGFGEHVRQPWTDPVQHGHGSGEHVRQPWADPVQHGHGSGAHVQRPWTDPTSQRHGSGEQVPQSDGARRPVYGAWQQPGSVAPVAGAMAAHPWRQGPERDPVPTKGAAIFAGSAMLLFSLAVLVFLIVGVSETLDRSRAGKDTSDAYLAIPVVVAIIVFTGAAGGLLLCARTAGRVMSVITAVLIGGWALFGVAASVASEVYAATAVTAAVFAFCAALGGCAASPSTGRWIRYRKAVRAHRW